MFAAAAAHVCRWLQATAKGGPLGAAENIAAVVVSQLDAAHAGRLSIRHAGKRAGDGWGGTAGAAGRAACQGGRW